VKEKTRILEKISNDKTRPVSFNESYGGSENQLRLLLKHLPDESFQEINLILNNTDYTLIDEKKINVVWMHHFIDQKEAKNLGSKEYIKKIDWIIFNSKWNFEKHLKFFSLPKEKCVVIKNAIEKINIEKKPEGKINLIYHTTPWRGLSLLLKVFKKLNLKNVELNVCSSTIIYGKKFDEIIGKKYEKIFDECKSTENVNYFGFLKNSETIELLKKMHIFSYPSIWPETSCISAIEAMAAGCQTVTTNLGALIETCNNFGTFVKFDRNFDNLEKNYSETLLKCIKNYWSDENQKKLKLQSESINSTYSWEVRSLEWKNFFDKIRKLKN